MVNVVGEFNFVVGGIATLAASVGYAFTRRRTLASDPRHSTQNRPDKSEATVNPQTNLQDSAVPTVAHEQPTIVSSGTSHPISAANAIEDMQTSTPTPSLSVLSRRPSLKRKRTADDNDEVPPDAGYPHNLASIYPPPKKRSRTPSTDEKSEHEGPAKEVEESCSPNMTPAVEDAVEKALPVANPAGPDCSAAVSLPSPAHTPKSSPRVSNEPLPSTPSPTFGTPVAAPSTPRTPPPTRAATMNAFSAFSGTASPFASFSASSPSRSSKPVWTSQENTGFVSSMVAPNQVSTSTDDDSAGPASPTRPLENGGHALEAVMASKSTVEYLTGEEDEDVELELKGVKLFVKRGDKPFSDGVVGHAKLLSSKTTLDERLLFRREPLWKVSMNVRMHPTVRCTYEPEENVLRLILQELVEQPNVAQEDRKKEIVVYALKPGRSCSKQDFKDFATSLVECLGLKPR